jgi:hypothetical protein
MSASLEREARRVLRRLRDGARLEPSGEGYALVGKRRGRVLPGELVAFMRARDWLRQEGEALFAGAEAASDPCAARHQLLATRLIKDDRGRDCYVVVNEAESPIAFLHGRGLIGRRQFEAAERLRRDFTLAQLTPRLGVDYTMPVGRRSLKPETLISETALAAKQRFNRAMRAAGPGLSDVLFDVCCMLRGIEECEQARNWPRASAKVVLRLALDRLIAHYGMRVVARARVRSWAKEDGG